MAPERKQKLLLLRGKKIDPTTQEMREADVILRVSNVPAGGVEVIKDRHGTAGRISRREARKRFPGVL